MQVATVLLAVAGDPNAEAARALRDFLTSWPCLLYTSPSPRD